MNSEALDFRWMAAESLAPTVVTALTDAGVDVGPDAPKPVPAHLMPDTEDAGFEPLLLIAGAAAIAHLALAVSRILRDHRQGGIVIDTRGETLTIRGGVPGVDAGTVVVVKDDGAQMLNAPANDTLYQILKS